MTDTATQSSRARLVARQGSWEQLGEDCRLIRHKVFVAEQQIPADEEWDEQDAVSEHFLLLVNDRPVATARVTPDGKIGRLAVLQPLRGKGLGEKIMQRAIEHCRRIGLKKVGLNAQISALGLYQKLGFKAAGEEYMEVGIPHLPMELELTTEQQQDSQLTESDILDSLPTTNQLRIQGHEQLRLCITTLIKQASRSFALETPAYIDQWFSEDTLSPLLSLARRHQHSRVQCLLGETRQFARQGGALLKLYQRAPSHIEIRQSHALYRPAQQALLLIDERHLLWWPHYRESRAELYTAEHREAYRAAQAFKVNWSKAEVSRHLQTQQL
ncbi:GNAT family N-acetyltransferase [Marinospirillum alkaliphilum]|uniref:Predicted N-acyltransferase, GNAT family n=1 Tax=Marinospirillum alkaliphilum DSM 21637 TaxID=1122209 RepID=A0A1K1TSC1_9GAMM|nr:GNAT family N-acetyltransferase [Marinospirillum alkaliphilum]SFX03673.1 Predicted N-acyltransferase, GNAT family [Marinospirillum alkaliphilum DSM 21637]